MASHSRCKLARLVLLRKKFLSSKTVHFLRLTTAAGRRCFSRTWAAGECQTGSGSGSGQPAGNFQHSSGKSRLRSPARARLQLGGRRETVRAGARV